MNPRESFTLQDRRLIDAASRMAAGRAFRVFKTAQEGADIAHQHGVRGSVDPDALMTMRGEARSCHWCSKSLGSKSNASFSHIQLLALGHGHDLANICVTCQDCSRERASLIAVDSEEFRILRRGRDAEAIQPMAGFTSTAADYLTCLHGEVVYALHGGDDSPWVFLTFGLAAYEERLRHLKLTHHDATLTLHTSAGKTPGYKGLVIRDAPTGERFMREVRRAGDVKVLGASILPDQ